MLTRTLCRLAVLALAAVLPSSFFCTLGQEGASDTKSPAGGDKKLELAAPGKSQDLAEPPSDPQAIAIVNRYLDARGGKKVFDAIQDKTYTFDTIKYDRGGKTVAKLKLYRKRGWKVREEWDIPEFSIKDQPLKFVQVYDGFDGFVSMFGTVSPLEGRTLSIFVWDKPIGDFFLTWKEDGYSLTYVNEGEVEGEPAEIVQTTDFTGKNRARYFFSKKTGLLLKKEWREQGRDGFVKKEDYYLKYRDIPFRDGSGMKLKIALGHKIFADGKPDTERQFQEATINSGLRDEIFAKPKGIAFTGGVGGGGALDSIKNKVGGAAPAAGPTPTQPEGQ